MNLQLLSAIDTSNPAFYTSSTDTLSKTAIDSAVEYGLPFSLFGFAVVFSVLALLFVVVTLFGKAFSNVGKEQKQKSVKVSEKKENVKVSNNQASVETVAPVAAVNADAGLIAAITAAIEAFRNGNGQGNLAFRVVSFKRRK